MILNIIIVALILIVYVYYKRQKDMERFKANIKN